MPTYDRMTLIWQTRKTPAGDPAVAAKGFTFETAATLDGSWNAAPVRGLASRNSRCGDFTDVTQLPPVAPGGPPGVPGLDGDCLLLTYRMELGDQYVRGTAFSADTPPAVSGLSNVLYLPETNLSAALIVGAVVVALLGMFRGTPKGPRGPLP